MILINFEFNDERVELVLLHLLCSEKDNSLFVGTIAEGAATQSGTQDLADLVRNQ